jgi:hypothetical protein
LRNHSKAVFCFLQAHESNIGFHLQFLWKMYKSGLDAFPDLMG